MFGSERMIVRELIQQLMKLDMNRVVQVYDNNIECCYEAELNLDDHENYVYIEAGKLQMDDVFSEAHE